MATVAKISIVTVEAECGRCGEGIPSPNGSYLIHIDQCPEGQILPCPRCGARNILPVRVYK